ncbi:MAG: SigE family RNA polymerase sigma factor [Acidimicrobiales bacterium]
MKPPNLAPGEAPIDDGLVPSEDSFDLFFRAAYPGAVSLAHVLISDRWLAEDLAQDAFSRLHPRFADLDSPAAFLRTCILNGCRSHHRRRGREQARLRRLTPAVPTTLGALELLDALDRLPIRQKAVLVLRYYEDLSEAEIAAVLDCRPGTVKSLASRGLARLHQEIDR